MILYKEKMTKKIFIILCILFSLWTLPSVSFAQEEETATSEEETRAITAEQVVQIPPSGNTTAQTPSRFENYKTLTCIPILTTYTNGVDSKAGCTIKLTSNGAGLGSFLSKMYNFGIGLAIALTILRIVYGGFLYSTQEAITGKSKAKQIIQNAFIGLFLVLGSWLILNTISPDILKFAVNLKPIDKATLSSISSNTSNPISGETKNTPNTTGSCSSLNQQDIKAIQGSFSLRKDLADKFNTMESAARSAGVSIQVTSAYRTPQDQERIWRQYNCKNIGGRSVCPGGKLVALPCSEGGRGSSHTDATAFDVYLGTSPLCKNGGSLQACTHPTAVWLKANAHKFGFKNSLDKDPIHWSESGR